MATVDFWQGSDANSNLKKKTMADDHEGLRAAASKVSAASQQRCRVHSIRNALAHAAPKQRPADAGAK